MFKAITRIRKRDPYTTVIIVGAVFSIIQITAPLLSICDPHSLKLCKFLSSRVCMLSRSVISDSLRPHRL